MGLANAPGINMRTGMIRTPFLALLLASACGDERLQGWEGDAPPNILFITVDTLRADALGLYGYKKPTSPELDAFAKTATVFEQAMSSSSWTLPSFASLFTSYYSSTHKCWKIFSKLDESFETLAEILTRHGFDTACFVSHTMLNPSQGMQQGFVHFDDSYVDPGAGTQLRISSEHISDSGVHFLQEKAAAQDGVPWMLWLHYFDPHSAYMPHEGITGTFLPETINPRLQERGKYDGEIKYTDFHLGRVFQALEAQGLADDTIVVFVADHGEEFWEHGNTEHGSTLYNELVRVPLLIRIPGEEPRLVRQVIRTVDVMPTLLDYSRATIDFEIEGKSLRKLIEGQHLSLPPALLEIQQSEKTMMKAIVREPWKLVHNISEKRFELYDLEADPGETNDLSAQHADVVTELGRTLSTMVRQAEVHGRGYNASSTEDVSPGQLEALRGLGYIGE